MGRGRRRGTARAVAGLDQVVAYGEIGLDYHWETVPRDRQQAVFAAQIAFAQTLSPTLPLIIHCRDAQDDVLAVLRASGTAAPVVMHCFTGDLEAARALLDAGYYLGIGGVATFKKSDALRDAIAAAPLDRLLLETDCPYLAPQAWRGRRNEPSYLPAVAQAVAAAKRFADGDGRRRDDGHGARLVRHPRSLSVRPGIGNAGLISSEGKSLRD